MMYIFGLQQDVIVYHLRASGDNTLNESFIINRLFIYLPSIKGIAIATVLPITMDTLSSAWPEESEVFDTSL